MVTRVGRVTYVGKTRAVPWVPPRGAVTTTGRLAVARR
jgi:hypothetical protein